MKKKGVLEYLEQTLIIGKTKSLLFIVINKLLKEKYSQKMPMLYTIPITYIDEEQLDILREHTANV